MSSSSRVRWPPGYFVLIPVIIVLVIMTFMAFNPSVYYSAEQVELTRETTP